MWQEVISCLYKKEDREDITNWLLLLLNYDNKIYTKILAIKIQPTLEDVIGPEKTAVIKRRTIIENLQLYRDVMSYVNANKIQTAMIALDQEKAFDRVDSVGRVDCNFLFEALLFRIWSRENTENKNSLSKHRNTDQGKQALVASFSSEKRTAARMPLIYDSVHYICGNIF